MCLVRSRPRWEEDVTFAPRPAGIRNARRHVSETVTTRRRDPPPVIYVPPETLPPPVMRPVTPPAPSPPSPARIELVSVEEDYHRRSPKTSRVSVSTGKGRRRSGGEEVYIERERERVRIPREERREEYETFRYVPGPERVVSDGPRRSTSRVVERERVVVNEGDRRREYYRRP